MEGSELGDLECTDTEAKGQSVPSLGKLDSTVKKLQGRGA